LKLEKKLSPTAVILLVSKLRSGRLVRGLFVLKLEKKLSPTVVMLLVSKLQSGKLVRAPSLLKLLKKKFHTLVALFPKYDKSGMTFTCISLTVVQACGTRGIPPFWKVHLFAPPVKASIMM
jgi:hypothetical protein